MADLSGAPSSNLPGAQALDTPLQQEDLSPATGLAAVETEHSGVLPSEHSEPNVLGFDATFLVALAMAVLIAMILWRRVPTLIAASLDNRIDAIREQLAEASSLRAEAEVLRSGYDTKLAALATEGDEIRQAARREADQIVEKARSDTDALIDRRRRMAEDRITAAEREAIAEVRARAANASTGAAARLLADRLDAAADHQLQERAIASLGRVN